MDDDADVDGLLSSRMLITNCKRMVEFVSSGLDNPRRSVTHIFHN